MEKIDFFLFSVRASADCDRFGFVTFFLASFDVKRCKFALLMLNFAIVVWGSDFLLWTVTVIKQLSLLEGLSMTFQDRMAVKRRTLL